MGVILRSKLYLELPIRPVYSGNTLPQSTMCLVVLQKIPNLVLITATGWLISCYFHLAQC